MRRIGLVVLMVPMAVCAKPMFEDAHDRVQTTLDPQLDRIGTLTPRSAREIGPSRLAVGCEMLPREYGDSLTLSSSFVVDKAETRTNLETSEKSF